MYGTAAGKATESLTEDRFCLGTRPKCDGSAMNLGSTFATIRSYEWIRAGLKAKPMPVRQTGRMMPVVSKGVDGAGQGCSSNDLILLSSVLGHRLR